MPPEIRKPLALDMKTYKASPAYAKFIRKLNADIAAGEEEYMASAKKEFEKRSEENKLASQSSSDSTSALNFSLTSSAFVLLDPPTLDLSLTSSAFHEFDVHKEVTTKAESSAKDSEKALDSDLADIDAAELAEFEVIPSPEQGIKVTPSKAKGVASLTKGQVVMELDPKDSIEEQFEPIAAPSLIELALTKYFDTLLYSAKVLWAAKSHIPVAASTALAMYSYMPLFVGAGALLATGASMEYAVNGNCQYTKAALGIGVTVTGLSTGAPLVQKLLVSSIAAVGIMAFGAAIFNPATIPGVLIGGTSSFLLSKTGYFLTSASCFAITKCISSLLSSNQEMIDYIKDQVRTIIVDEVLGELGRQVQNCNDKIVLGFIPLGKILSPVTNYLNKKMCAKVEDLGNNLAEGISNIGKTSEESFLKQWSANGDKFISSFTFIYQNLIEFTPPVFNFCKDYYQQKTSFAENLNSQPVNVFCVR